MRQSLVALALVIASCTDQGPPLGLFEQNGTSANGTSVNGTSVNGTSVNGTSVNGTSVNGTSVNGTSVNGTSVNGTSTTGAPITGAAMVGSTWTATTSNGATLPLRIDTAEQGTGANSDLWFYGVSYQNSTGWYPLCVDATGAAVKALPVAGTWSLDTITYSPSTTTFTWACRGKTIAKCVELGYKTWKGYTNQLMSCVRMLRGDYCGTGVSYTVDGQLLNLYDNVGVQLDTQGWGVEGEWSPTGAACVTNAGYTRFSQASRVVPPCLARLQTPTCGAFRRGTYLVDELAPPSFATQQSTNATK